MSAADALARAERELAQARDAWRAGYCGCPRATPFCADCETGLLLACADWTREIAAIRAEMAAGKESC